MAKFESFHGTKDGDKSKSVIVCEDVFTEDELNELEAKCVSQGEIVPTDNCNEHLIQTRGYIETEFFNKLKKYHVIPDVYQYQGACFRIIQNKNGQLFPHTDLDKYFSISTYLNSVDGGGELQFYLDDTIFTVEPKRGKVVIMTNNILHWTLPVKKGQRKSIQFFVEFIL